MRKLEVGLVNFSSLVIVTTLFFYNILACLLPLIVAGLLQGT